MQSLLCLVPGRPTACNVSSALLSISRARAPCCSDRSPLFRCRHIALTLSDRRAVGQSERSRRRTSTPADLLESTPCARRKYPFGYRRGTGQSLSYSRVPQPLALEVSTRSFVRASRAPRVRCLSCCRRGVRMIVRVLATAECERRSPSTRRPNFSDLDVCSAVRLCKSTCVRRHAPITRRPACSATARRRSCRPIRRRVRPR
jgi:hypothetical protein